MLAMLLCSRLLPAQVPAGLGPPVLTVGRIIITNIGPQAVSESLIRANIRVKEGEPFSRHSVDDDVRNLYSTGYFQNIRVAEERTDDKITLIYIVQGKLKLTDILFSGNKEFSSRKLRKKVTSKIGEPMDERKLFADAEAMKKLYQKSGYSETQVKYSINPDERTGRGTVTFEVTESLKVKIIDVVFDGATAFSQKKLRKKIKTRRHWMFSWITGSGVLKAEQLEDDKDTLAEFYRSEGYIDFDLREVRSVQKSPRKIELHFIVSEGRRYKVGAVEFKGVSLFSTNDLYRKIKMGVGQTFTPKGLSKDLEIIQDFYGTKGYIGPPGAEHIPIIARKKPNIQTGTMDLLYELEEGEKSYIEKIEIKGNNKTKDRVLRRELAVAPGEVFDLVKVKLSKTRLEGLNFFERVETQAEPTEIPNRRNLLVAVSEKNTGNVTLGAGFSTVDSIIGFAEITQANFDLFNPPWFTGGGQKARLRATLGTERQDYQLTFIEPWFLEKKLELSVDLYHRQLNFVSIDDLYSERRTGARVGLVRALGSDFLKGGLSYTIEDVGIDLASGRHGPLVVRDTLPGGGQVIRVVPPNTSEEILREEGDRLVSKVGLSLVYDTSNNALLPDRGQRTEFRAELAGGPFGGETDFYKLELGTVWYFRGFREGHVLEVGGRVGVINFYGNSDHVPLFDEWFLGGIDTLRGFRYRQVGPRDEFDEPIGGNTYWFGSAEYSIPIIERLRFAVFYDAGMVYRDAYSFDPKGFDTGVYNDNWGVGLRLNLPIGPLRLDYGIPITADRHNDSSGRFQFSVGYRRNF
jgi:outer membrane protein insertion porin family